MGGFFAFGAGRIAGSSKDLDGDGAGLLMIYGRHMARKSKRRMCRKQKSKIHDMSRLGIGVRMSICIFISEGHTVLTALRRILAMIGDLAVGQHGCYRVGGALCNSQTPLIVFAD